MKMKIDDSKLFFIVAATAAVSFFAGCASMETGNTTSLLSAAEFRTRTPQTAKQKELYAALPSNKLEHATVKGKGYYVFKDKKAGMAYIGGEPEHQRYQQLCVQQHVAQPPEEEMNHPFAQAWSTQWGGGRDAFR